LPTFNLLTPYQSANCYGISAKARAIESYLLNSNFEAYFIEPFSNVRCIIPVRIGKAIRIGGLNATK